MEDFLLFLVLVFGCVIAPLIRFCMKYALPFAIFLVPSFT
jgi:hypothetical protein